MKVVYILLALVAVLCVHCGGGETPPPQDPSTVPAAPSVDADAAVPQSPAPDQPKQ